MDRQSLDRSVGAGKDAGVDRAGLADFLRRRREALQPRDVGMAPGLRRRTAGLRREEVAVLAAMSTDYYARLEQQRGPQPSEQMIAAIARALRLTLDERDHLFRLAGHVAPTRVLRSDHVSPGLMRVLDRLDDTPAQVISDIAETLVQNRLATALLGDQTKFEGFARSAVYRWFTDPLERRIYPERDHDLQSRVQVANLRVSATRGGPDSRAAAVVTQLRQESADFERIWTRHEVTGRSDDNKTIVHPELGEIELQCQVLSTQDHGQALLVFTASPGSEGYSKLQLLSVIGTQHLLAGPTRTNADRVPAKPGSDGQ
jgi:transcriptional regulator with XRE-family HTH domain